MNEGQTDFRDEFAQLTGNGPFVWQEDLFAAFMCGEVPEQICIPTGCGKTALMGVWLLALARHARTGTCGFPRRLVWVVHNRAVVDQATDDAETIAAKMSAPPADLLVVAEALRSLSGIPKGKAPLAVSTLRGERADNREWSDDPSRPAIVIGTVDMVGSRLLFRGYGDNRKWRARHAGLLGQDSLIVNDEAHLTPAFVALLDEIRQSQRSGAESARALRFIRLSATPRGNAGEFPPDLSADVRHPEFRKRVEARKRLELCPAADVKGLRAEIVARARAPHRGTGNRTIVYIRNPDEAGRIAREIEKAEGKDRVRLLTGTMRGHERDRLVETEVFKRFISQQPVDGPAVWLVATSAGEVGINIDAERVVSDLDTADHLLQRLGRLNRFGNSHGEAYVAWSTKGPTGKKQQEREERLAAAREYLTGLPECDGGHEVSPATLWNNRPPVHALSPVGKRPPLLPWLVEAWSLTSLDGWAWKGRPEVQPWLHGADDDPPATQVAWREDMKLLADADPTEIEHVLEAYPVRARERLQEPTRSIQEKLTGLAKAFGDRRIVVVRHDGSAESMQLRQAADRDTKDLRYALVLLPSGVGRLSGGTLEVGPTDEDGEYDVADVRGPGEMARARFRVALERSTWIAHPVGVKDSTPVAVGKDCRPATLRRFGKERGWLLRECVEVPNAGDGAGTAEFLVYFSEASDRERDGFIPLSVHTEAVEKTAKTLAASLGFGPKERQAMELAATWHDCGKMREQWQTAAGNQGDDPVGKAPYVNAKILAGYRHELGSLVEAECRLPRDIDMQTRDLALHLIASHHGWARPYFRDIAADRSSLLRSRSAVIESARRFARLQERYGAWGLAYLEAVFCAADALASALERKAVTSA
jgi:CRISPR-associated endonuclease/helicase Cas3